MTRKQKEIFFDKLEGPEGCDFKQKDPKDDSTTTWKCKGGMDKTYARNILKEMKISDEEAAMFLTECDSHGGHCDCEIIFNSMEYILG